MVTLMMSPGALPPGLLCTKFEKKNAFWLATQVGPSAQLYCRLKPVQACVDLPIICWPNGPGGQVNAWRGPPASVPCMVSPPLIASIDPPEPPSVATAPPVPDVLAPPVPSLGEPAAPPVP